MAETKKPFYTGNGMKVDGDLDFTDNVLIGKKLSFGNDGKLILRKHSNAGGIENECRLNATTGDFEVFDTIWKSAFVGGLKWDAAEAQFTITRLTDNKKLVVPYVHETDSILKNVQYYQAEAAGTAAKPSYGLKDNAGDGMFFISDGVAFAGGGKDLFQADTTSFRLKYGDNGAEIFVANSTGISSKVNFTADSTFNAKGKSEFEDDVTISNGDLDITSGRVLSGGNVIGFSDERIKDDFQAIENAVERILRMEGVTYHNLVTGKREAGLKAQQVREALAEAVTSTGKDIKLLTGEEIENVLAVAYGNLAGLWVEGFRELDKRLKSVEDLCSKDQDK
ncbi:long tail fiber protein distal subunit [Vibrio phage D528]